MPQLAALEGGQRSGNVGIWPAPDVPLDRRLDSRLATGLDEFCAREFCRADLDRQRHADGDSSGGGVWHLANYGVESAHRREQSEPPLAESGDGSSRHSLDLVRMGGLRFGTRGAA